MGFPNSWLDYQKWRERIQRRYNKVRPDTSKRFPLLAGKRDDLT